VRLFSLFGKRHLPALLGTGLQGKSMIKNGFKEGKNRLGKKVLRKAQVALSV